MAHRLLGALGVAVLLPASVLVLENVFINTGLHLLVNPQPERALITWRAAYSIWPGEVHAWGLGVRVQDAQTQWELTSEQVSGVIDLPALLEHRFAASALRGDGATFRMRMRVEVPPPSGVSIATPAITGLENPPSPSPEAAYGPPGRLFRIELDDVVVAHLREIWVEDYRFVGDSRLSGELDLLGGEWFGLPQATLEVASGDVTLASAPIASAVRGRIDAAVSGGNPADLPGLELLSAITARARLDADVEDLRFLSFYLRKAPWLTISGGKGPLSLDVSIDQGRFLDGSRLAVDARNLVARFLSYAVSGDGKVRVDVAGGTGASEGKLGVDFFDYSISKWGDDVSHVRGTGLRVTARTSSLTLSEPFESLSVTLDIPDSTIPDASVYNVYLPNDLGFSLLGGAGRAHGHLEASTEDGLARGDLYLEASSVRGRMGDVGLAGNVSVHAHLAEGNLETGTYDISGSRLKLRSVAVVDRAEERKGRDDSRGWWADISLPKGRAIVGAPVFLDAHLGLSCRDSVPFVTIFSQMEPLPGWARGLLHVKRMSGEAHVLLGDDTLFVPAFTLRGGQTELRMRLRRKRLEYFGNLYARFGILSLGLELEGPKSEVHLFGALPWYQAQPAP